MPAFLRRLAKCLVQCRAFFIVLAPVHMIFPVL